MSKIKVPDDIAAQAATPPSSLARYDAGWRNGKPVEDPAKLKRMGFITAKPSEYLVVVTGGRINTRRSGQGNRVWKWPWNAVAIVPTTLQQIEFSADQITRERVGVTVTGIAVYRIAQPEVAYRMLNFTYGERASEKLAQTLREMFIGAARRLIANLTLDQCLMNRKESIATYLMQEIAPVVSGSGRAEDTTDQGWGVVLDTIEIQDVKIQSKQVFEHLQAPYRAEIAMRAEIAELERQRQVSERRSATERQTAEVMIQTQRETRILKAKAEAEAAQQEATETMRAEQAKARTAADELERKEALARKRLTLEEGIAVRQAESKTMLELRQAEAKALLELRQAEAKAAMEAKAQALKQEAELQLLKGQEQKRLAAAQTELATLQAEAELAEQSHRAELHKLELEHARRALQQQASLSLLQQRSHIEQQQRRQEAETKALEAAVEAKRQRDLADIEVLLNQGRALRELVTQGLPQLAQAFKQNFGTVNYTQLSGAPGDGPMNLVGGAITQVLTLAKSFGFDLSKLGQPPSLPAAPPSPSEPQTGSSV